MYFHPFLAVKDPVLNVEEENMIKITSHQTKEDINVVTQTRGFKLGGKEHSIYRY